jgi:hypothetical protein
MTAIAIAAQPDCIHVAADAAYYDQSGFVDSFADKGTIVLHWPAFFIGTGNSGTQKFLARELAHTFGGFDEFVDGAEHVLPGLLRDRDWPTAELIVAGISAERGPEAWSFVTDNKPPPGMTEEEAAATKYRAEPLKLVKLGAVVMTPVPADQVQAANWQGIKPDAPFDEVLWSLRKLITMQRHTALPDEVGGIGGFGTVTSVYADRIEQRVVVRWPEDQIGTKLQPAPIDWGAWHRDNPPPSVTIPAGMSRARREMLERKARKANLKVVR